VAALDEKAAALERAAAAAAAAAGAGADEKISSLTQQVGLFVSLPMVLLVSNSLLFALLIFSRTLSLFLSFTE
jgi:hypothetical protein